MINEIVTDENYKNICKRITNYDYRWEDLHQEFCIVAIEREAKLRTLTKEQQNLYCYGVISIIWNNKNKLTKYRSPSTLYDIKDGFFDIDEYRDEIGSREPTGAEKELKRTLIKHLNKLILSDNSKTRFEAELLNEFINGTNRNKIAERRNLNYRTVYEAIEEAKIKIKQLMGQPAQSKNDITIKLSKEQIQTSYSGKEKTFYVTKQPSQSLELEITKAGFKVKKK